MAARFQGTDSDPAQAGEQLSPGAKLPKFWRYALVVALLISLAAAVVAAANRVPWSDEGSLSSASYNLAKHGFLGTTVLETAGTGLTRLEQHTYWVMPLYLVGQALWYRFFPSTVLSTRGFTILWAPVLLCGFYVFLTRLLLPPATAALATCLLALSFIFIDNAGFARPDLMCCALGVWGLAAYLLLRERSLGWALFLANAFIAASGLTHPNGILHFFGLAVLVVWYDRRRLSAPVMAAAIAPYFLFGAGWLVYVSQDFTAFLDQMRANGMNNERWTATLNPALVVWNEIRDRYLVAFGFVTGGVALAKGFALGAYLAAAGGCLAVPGLRSRRSTQVLLVLLAIYFAIMAIFNQKLSYYLIHIVPWYIALLAVWCVHLWNGYNRVRPIIVAGLLVLVAVETGGILLKARQRSYVAAQRTLVRYLLSQTPPSGRIVGSAGLIYELGFDGRFRDDAYLGIRSGSAPAAIVIDDLYRDLYAPWRKERAADMKRIDARLASYRLAYHISEYDIYLRPGK